ncbi:hypothetical protein ACEQ8H_005406 [Pleosporales sp. CAS-2024a]
MSRSNDPGHYFQTTSALNETARKAAKSKNTNGRPIKLPSKILAVVADPQEENQVYVAEAAGNVKLLNIQTSSVTCTFSGPTAPLTSVAVAPGHGTTVLAGCWDKSIWSWSASTRKPGKRFEGHTDFVKAIVVCVLDGKDCLISASADATIIVWHVASGAKLHTIKGHTRGILALAIDPNHADIDMGRCCCLVSAGSDREIRRWHVSPQTFWEMESSPIIAHETSVNAIRFDADYDLWTASADKTAKCLVRARQYQQDTQLEHPDFVRDVAIDDEGGWIATACRDEEVRVWDKATGKLHHTFTGHFEEVTALLLLPRQRLISVGIDATVRQWSLRAPELAKAVQEAEEERLGKTKEQEPETKKEGIMTAEEEAELAELLEDSE